LWFILGPRLGLASDLFCYLLTGLAQGFIQRHRIALVGCLQRYRAPLPRLK
jgi:hypothetical protein